MYKANSLGQYNIHGTVVDFLVFHCPQKQGHYECGTFTPEANSFALFVTTTERFNAWLKYIFELVWKRNSREGNCFHRFKKEPLTDDFEFSFGGGGGGWDALNEICWSLDARLKVLVKEGNAAYNREVEEDERIKIEGVVLTDFRNWCLRAFQDWCNDNKRVPANLEGSK